jgi:hypothetical protein
VTPVHRHDTSGECRVTEIDDRAEVPIPIQKDLNSERPELSDTSGLRHPLTVQTKEFHNNAEGTGLRQSSATIRDFGAAIRSSFRDALPIVFWTLPY